MTPDQLADHVRTFVSGCIERVVGVGAQQYSQGTTQKFEIMPLGQLIDWTDEELQDVVVYAVMLSIRLRGIRDRVAADLEHRLTVLDEAAS